MKKNYLALRTLFIGVLSAFVFGGCVNQNQQSFLFFGQDLEDYWDGDSIEGDPEMTEELKTLMGSMVHGEKEIFASLVSYPLERMYPLHNIQDSASLVSYFDTLVDDSLKTVLKNTRVSDWGEFGWHGYSFSDGEYLWWNGSLVGMNYYSQKELEMRDALIQKELASLSPTLTEGDWTVYECLIPSDSPYCAIRLDVLPFEDEEDQYRLAFYENGADLNAEPALVLLGSLDIQGSFGTHNFYFSNKEGNVTADFVYSPYEYMEEEGTELTLRVKGKETVIPIRFGYWLDLL